MELRELLGAGPPGIEVGALAFDNRKVAPGTLFFCVPGFTSDGHDYAADAVKRGAVALVVERPLGLGVPEVQVPKARPAMAQAAARFYGDPTHTLKVAGVTGTSGKTTTTFILRHLLETAGIPTGLLGTVKALIGGREVSSVRTTPEAFDLQQTFADMLAAGDQACAMEVSSHALELHRVDAIHYAVAVFTNLSQDHLDFHPDMESYFQAKRALFLGDHDVQQRAVCIEDSWGERLAREIGDQAITVGIRRDAHIHARDLRTELSSSTFTLVTPEGTATAHLPLPGRFNVLNALCAAAAARALGLSPEAIAQGLSDAPAVPGRLQPVDAGQDFAVWVDYAHKPGALETVLHAARDLTRGKVICVIGAGGDRDRGKRPEMGRIAAELSDTAIITSDNPRSEDPQAIIDQIITGIPQGTPIVSDPDRREAIRYAIEHAQTGDVVVIAGKGHERGQEFADGRVEPFDDVEVARTMLERQEATNR